MKAAIVILLLLGLATVWGAQSVFIGVRDRNLIEISCADYVADPPAGRWVKLVDCDPDPSSALERLENGKLDAVFIPLRPRGQPAAPAHLIVETDGDYLPASVHTVQGMMRIGFLDAPSDEALARIARDTGSAPDAVILSLGGEPHLWLGLLALIGGFCGLVFAGLMIWRWWRAR
jgi:hypothetical protein